MDINTAAPAITREEILIHALIETIWKIQTDVTSWPSWQPDVDGAETEGPLAVGSVFRWQTGGLDITSTVAEVDAPPDRLGLPGTGHCGCPRLDSRRGRRRRARPHRGVVGGRPGDSAGGDAADRARSVTAKLARKPEAQGRSPSVMVEPETRWTIAGQRPTGARPPGRRQNRMGFCPSPPQLCY